VIYYYLSVRFSEYDSLVAFPSIICLSSSSQPTTLPQILHRSHVILTLFFS
jgi:hypothetical protein